MAPPLVADTAAGTLALGPETVPARFGRAGACLAADKREGDGRTPLGRYALTAALLRPDRGLAAPRTALPWRWLRPQDGWSDDPHDPAYNRPVTHPHLHSAERLWRNDDAYDILLTLSHNTPPTPGLGSAIFLHCLQPDARPTEGCIAIDRDTLARWLPQLTAATPLDIV
ncbi:L,D-transpeptidase family protein [Polymorphobacter sp.]|uniref:L,D-transpeptidase family protein n=1 Tax=Polymorphobacter sp. TaxID=1909290 RepID=UPI003F70F480